MLGCQLEGVLSGAAKRFLETLDGYTVVDLTRNREWVLKLIGEGVRENPYHLQERLGQER